MKEKGGVCVCFSLQYNQKHLHDIKKYLNNTRINNSLISEVVTQEILTLVHCARLTLQVN